MGEAISFSGVKDVAEKGYTRPGTIDVFTLTKVEFTSSKNKGTPGMKVSFDRKQDGFNHTFYLTPKALGRIKLLSKKVAGREIGETETLTEEQLIKILEGKKGAIKVTGKVDETTGKGYADISFGGFCESADRVDFLSFTTEEEKLNELALIAIERSRRQPDDTSSGGETTGEGNEGGTPKKW